MWLIERVGDSSKCEIKSTTNIYNKHLNIEIKNTTNHTNIQQLFVRCSGYINGVFIVFNWCRRWIFIAILLFWTGLMYVKEVYSSMYNVSAPKMMYRLMHRSRSLGGRKRAYIRWRVVFIGFGGFFGYGFGGPKKGMIP